MNELIDPIETPEAPADPGFVLTDDPIDTSIITSEPIKIDETAAYVPVEMTDDNIQIVPPEAGVPLDTVVDDGEPPTSVDETQPPEAAAPPAPPPLIVVTGTDGFDLMNVTDGSGYDLHGLGGDDVMASITGGNRMQGGAGNDLMISIGGDTMIGGDGGDVFMLQIVPDWRGPTLLADFCAEDSLQVIAENGHSKSGFRVDGVTVFDGDVAIATLPSADLGYLIY